MAIDFGLVLPAGPQQNNKRSIDAWLDDLDALLPSLAPRFSGLWMTDHFFWEDQPTYEAWTVLAFAAARWPQFQIGPIVLGQSYRNPALLAKMAATLQALCRGRFIMALGAGWKEDEYYAYGYPFPSPGVRVAQLEDSLEIMTRLWQQPGPVSYQGAHYSISNAYCEPKPDPIPKIIVGGGGKKTMRLAARFADWWSLPDANVAAYRAHLPTLDQHCQELGRDPKTLRRTWFGRLAVGQTEAEAESLSAGRWTRANALVGTPTQVLDQIGLFIDAGVDYFMVEVLGLNQPDIRERVMADVLAKVELT